MSVYLKKLIEVGPVTLALSFVEGVQLYSGLFEHHSNGYLAPPVMLHQLVF